MIPGRTITTGRPVFRANEAVLSSATIFECAYQSLACGVASRGVLSVIGWPGWAGPYTASELKYTSRANALFQTCIKDTFRAGYVRVEILAASAAGDLGGNMVDNVRSSDCLLNRLLIQQIPGYDFGSLEVQFMQFIRWSCQHADRAPFGQQPKHKRSSEKPGTTGNADCHWRGFEDLRVCLYVTLGCESS